MSPIAIAAFDLDELDASVLEIVDLGNAVPASLTAGHGLTELAASGKGHGCCSCCSCCPCCCC